MSDTHSQHGRFKVPKGDLFLHTGDFCGYSTIGDVQDFCHWLKRLRFKHKVVIAGNHDWPFEREEEREEAEGLMEWAGVTYLNDSGTEVEGLRIWGSPISPRFGNWAFYRDRGEDIRKHWDMIPNDTDILLTHGPPYSVLDQVFHHTKKTGCEELLVAVERVRPKLHVFGHIHEGHGQEKRDGTLFINAANCDERYRPVNQPIVVNWKDLA